MTKVKEKTETETKKTTKINIEILNLFSSFFRKCGVEGVWFNKDHIVMAESGNKSLRYTPNEPIFKEEFGIEPLHDFISYLKIMPSCSIEYKLPKIFLKDEKKKMVIEIRTSPKTSFEKEFEVNELVRFVMDKSKELIEEKKCIEFMLDNETIADIKTFSGTFKNTNDTKLTIGYDEKDEKDAVTLTVSNKNTAHVMNKVVPAKNLAGLKNFTCVFDVDNVYSMEWKTYVFNEEFENPDGESMSTEWAYLVNEERNLECLIIFDVENGE